MGQFIEDKVQKRLLQLFADVLAGKAEQITAIKQSTAQIGLEHGILVFSIEGLFCFICDEGEMSLRAFKKQLYQGSLNDELAAIGAKVDVYQSVGQTKTRLYCLVGLSHNKEQGTI